MPRTNELTDEQFHATFAEPMVALGEDDDGPEVDLSEYVEACITRHKLRTSTDEIEVHHVYRTGDGKYTHILLWYGKPNVYLVVVVRNEDSAIFGHHILDLNEKYGR